MTEVEDCRLVRHSLTPKINADEMAHGNRIIQRLLSRRIRQVEPVLQKVQSQRSLQPDRRAAVSRLRIIWLDDRAQFAPRHHLLHLAQERRPTRQLAMFVETCR